MLQYRQNPLFPPPEQTLDVAKLTSPTVFLQKRPSSTRVIKRLTRGESAAQALSDWSPGMDCFGFTKGQFSLLELIATIIDKIGPAHMVLATWTAAHADLDHVHAFLQNPSILSARFLLDFTFQRRQPEIAQKLRNTFGPRNIRVTRNHAKFCMLWNDNHRLSLKTSMNLNTNPRFEDFDICHDPDLFDFLKTICQELFENMDDQAAMTSNQLAHQFRDLE